MRGMRALCRSRIPELARGAPSAGRNTVCTPREGWREGPGAGGAFWHPPEAMAGNGDAGKQWRGQQHPDIAREVVAGCAGARRGVIWAVHSGGCQPACPDSASLSGPGSSSGLSSAPLPSLISRPRASLPAGAFGRQGCAFAAAPSSPQGRTWPLRPLGGGRQSSTGQKSILIMK